MVSFLNVLMHDVRSVSEPVDARSSCVNEVEYVLIGYVIADKHKWLAHLVSVYEWKKSEVNNRATSLCCKISRGFNHIRKSLTCKEVYSCTCYVDYFHNNDLQASSKSLKWVNVIWGPSIKESDKSRLKLPGRSSLGPPSSWLCDCLPEATKTSALSLKESGSYYCSSLYPFSWSQTVTLSSQCSSTS